MVTDSMIADAIGGVIGALFSVMGIALIFGIAFLVGIVALITWVVKKVWNADKQPKQKPQRHAHQDNDWLTGAQRRQQQRYENSDPVGGWSYNKNARMWVDPDQTDEEERRRARERVRDNWNKCYESRTGKWSPTGWYYNEKTGQWEPPDHVVKESAETWQWDAEKQIWINVKEERRKERYREYHKNQPPTFEEWKAQREAEQAKENEKHPE